MRALRRLAALLAVLAIALSPAAALAQSGGAGDNQYEDPFSGNSQQQSSGSSGSNTQSSAPASSPTPSTTASSGQSAPAAPATSSTQTQTQTLPRTGADAGVVAAIGAALLLAGAVLRRRLRHERL